MAVLLVFSLKGEVVLPAGRTLANGPFPKWGRLPVRFLYSHLESVTTKPLVFDVENTPD